MSSRRRNRQRFSSVLKDGTSHLVHCRISLSDDVNSMLLVSPLLLIITVIHHPPILHGNITEAHGSLPLRPVTSLHFLGDFSLPSDKFLCSCFLSPVLFSPDLHRRTISSTWSSADLLPLFFSITTLLNIAAHY